MGLERLREALEANDWNGAEVSDDDFDIENLGEDDDDDERGSLGFGIDKSELEEEMAGMKKAIYGGGVDDEDVDIDQDEEVGKLQAMMLKMQAVRGKFFNQFHDNPS